MSIVSEYFEMALQGLKNPKQVFEGFVNELNHENLPDDVKEVIAKRRLICEACPFMSKNAEIISGKKFSRIEKFCTLCSCPIATKTSSMSSSCGADIYNRSHPDNKQEVKWTSYDKESKSRGFEESS